MHKGWVRIVNFLKIPPANVQSREAAFECAREGEEGVRWGGVKIGICGNYSLPDFCVTNVPFTEFLW